MDLNIISFTEKGMQLSLELATKMSESEMTLYTKCTAAVEKGLPDGVQWVQESVSAWTGEQMRAKRPLLFIGACGIAVRAIAAYVTDKLKDGMVLVMDEEGEYVIPLLSGHVGGANEAARQIAACMGAVPVITTATDLQGKFAVDVFACRNGLVPIRKEGIARVSAKVLSGQKITISVPKGHLAGKGTVCEGVRLVPYPPKQETDVVISTQEEKALLLLRPRQYVIGMGCRKDTDPERIEALICQKLQMLQLKDTDIYALASIDRKRQERGLVAWAAVHRVPFYTYSAQELSEISANLHSSEFVREQVGVDNVCERAALRACGAGGSLVCERYAADGITIAIARRKWVIEFDES